MGPLVGTQFWCPTCRPVWALWQGHRRYIPLWRSQPKWTMCIMFWNVLVYLIQVVWMMSFRPIWCINVPFGLDTFIDTLFLPVVVSRFKVKKLFVIKTFSMVFVIHLHKIDLTDDKRIHTPAKCYIVLTEIGCYPY